MTFDDGLYWKKIANRTPQSADGQSWKCLCCKDIGIADSNLVRQYYEPDLIPSDIGSRCERPGCGAGARYPPSSLKSIGPAACQWLHDKAVEALKKPPDQQLVLTEVKNSIQQFRSVPTVEQRPIDPILANDPDGRRIAEYDDF